MRILLFKIEVIAVHSYKYNMEFSISPLFPAKLCGSNFETAYHLYYFFFTAYALLVFTNYGLHFEF